MKILEENMGVSLHDLRLGNGLKQDTKGTRNKQTKKDDFYSIEINNFYASEIIEGKDNPQNWQRKKKISIHLSDKDLVTRVCRELIQFSSVQSLSHV